MGALPRAELQPGAQRDLNEALHAIHHQAGWPSLRTLAAAAGCSHTTVSGVFSSPRLPAWGLLELIIEYLDGDVDRFHQLWLAASAPLSTDTAAPGLVGRADELAAVRRHLEGRTGLLVVTGEAGMGKSRLVAAAVEASDAPVALGACLPLSQAVPLMPIADALASASITDRGGRVDSLLSHGPAYLRPALARLLPELETGSGPDPDRRQVFLAVERLLAGAGPRLPLVLDDLHWADPATLDLLEHLVARQAPVALLGTWRLDDPVLPEVTRDWWQRVRRLPSASTLALGPLDRIGTKQQIEQLGVTADPDLVNRVYARSGGRPLFTEQLAVHGGADLPDLLADLLDRRLSALGRDAELVATRLGVADRPLAAADLTELTGLSRDRLDAALHELSDRFLLAARPSDVTLRHPLLAEAARLRLLPHERQAVHGRVAEQLGRSTTATAAEIAEHWRAARDDTQELGWRVAAARTASTRISTTQAAEEWLRVLELWPDDGSRSTADHADALVEAMTCLTASSRLERAGDLVPLALELAEDLDAGTAARVFATAGSVRGALRGPTEALPLLHRALALHEELPPSSDQVRALGQLAGQLRGMGRYDEAGVLIGRTVAVAEQIGDDTRQLRSHLELLAWHQTMAGQPRAAEATRARADTMTAGALPDHVWISVVRTDALLVTGAPCQAVESAAAPGLALARDEDITSHSVALLQGNTAQALISAGRVSAAWELIDPVTRGEPGVDNWPVFIARMSLETFRGHLDEAALLLDAMSAVPITAVTNQAERAERSAVVTMWRGDPGSAELLLTSTIEELRDTVAAERAGALLTLLARAAADRAAGHPAPEIAHSLTVLRRSMLRDPLADDAVAGDSVARATQWDAELGRLAGRPNPATWVRAANAWDPLERPHDAAYCRWRGAQAALSQGTGTLAARLLRRAAGDAREHVPLSRAIAETATSAHQRA